MMKRISMMLLLLVGFATVVSAQNKATAILAEVTKKYKSYDVVKADFTLTINNPKANIKQTEKGTLYVKANANKYKMTTADRDLLSDGKTQWTYLKDDQEVQVTDVDQSADALNPAQIFTMYQKGYAATYAGENKVGNKSYQLIDLKPTSAGKSYSKVRLNIDNVSRQIASMQVYDKNGGTYVYRITSFAPNVKVPETTFSFDAKKHPGVEVVDLR